MGTELRLLLATTNPGKLRELRALLAGMAGLSLLEPADVGGLPAVVEDGASFEDNARKKAHEIALAHGVATLSDDSGLEVDALSGRPGVRSARYAGEHASDDDNNRKLVAELASVPEARRSARYRAVIAFCDPAPASDGPAPRVRRPLIHTEQASCEGTIVLSPRGQGGFGYDPHFVPDGHACTMAELTLDAKNALSHRARAVAKMRAFLASYLARRTHA
jgi:XTP/dITP diphosphohydrolase